jgi:hypothetical protein
MVCFNLVTGGREVIFSSANHVHSESASVAPFFYSKYKTSILISQNWQAIRPTFLRPPDLNVHSYKTNEKQSEKGHSYVCVRVWGISLHSTPKATMCECECLFLKVLALGKYLEIHRFSGSTCITTQMGSLRFRCGSSQRDYGPGWSHLSQV